MALGADFEKLDRQLARLERRGIKGAQKSYAAMYRKLRSELSGIFDKYADSQNRLSLGEMTKYNRLDSMKKKVADIIRESYVSTGREVRSALRDVARTSHDGTLQALSDAAGRTLRGKIKGETITEHLQDPRTGLKLNERLSVQRQQIVARIDQEITRGLARGDSFRDITHALREEIDMDLAKTTRVVRTEGHRVQEQARLDALDHADAQGVVMMKRWVSARDERVRASHEHMHGQEVDYEDDFVNPYTGGEGPAPGMMGTAADDINCRCRMVVDIVGTE